MTVSLTSRTTWCDNKVAYVNDDNNPIPMGPQDQDFTLAILIAYMIS